MKSFLSRLFQKKHAVPSSQMAFFGNYHAHETSRTYKGFTEEGYKKNVIVFRCINMISTNTATIPWLLYRKRGRKMREEIIEHPILNLLAKPNAHMPGPVFEQALMSYLLLSGNAFIHAVGSSKTAVRELWPLRPDRFRVCPGRFGIPEKYEYRVDGVVTTYDVEQLSGNSPILHVKTFNPDNEWEGQSPIGVAARSVDLLNAAGRWNLSLLQNSAKPSGAIVMKASENGLMGALTEQQMARLRKDIEEVFSGVRNAGRPFILEGGMDYKPISLSPVDMDYLNSKKTSEKDVALVFGVPSQLVGVEDSQKFENYRQAREAFFEDTVLPWKRFFRDYLNNWLVPAFKDPSLELGVDEESVEALAGKKEAKWKRAETAPWLTTNEKRELAGYGRYEPDAKDAADRIFMPMGQIPIEYATETSAPPVATDTGDLEEMRAGKKPVKEPEEEEDDALEELPEEDETEGGEKSSKATITYLDGKAINIATPRGRRNYWLSHMRKQRAFEKVFGTQLRAAFAAEGEELASSLKGVDPSLREFVLNGVLEKSRARFMRIFESNLSQVMESFGADTLNLQKSQKDANSKLSDFMKRYLRFHVSIKVDAVQTVTRKKLKKTVSDTSDDIDIPTEVKESYAKFGVARAATIARSEVHTASMQASQAAAKALTLPNVKKEWVSSQDARSRGADENDATNHLAMNGATVDLDEKFEVASKDGVDLMDGPGDPSAPLDQIINCRCVLAYTTGEE